MKMTFSLGDKHWEIDVSKGVDISLPFHPTSGPRAWGAGNTQPEPVRYGDWVGSVKRGASVNFFDVTINPHGQGTHTECAGHILPEQQSVHNKVAESFIPAQLVSVFPKDNVLHLGDVPLPSEEFPYRALLVRSLPNSDVKKEKNYFETDPPYFLPEDLHRLARAGVQHFLTDLPSVDREKDGGALAAHRAFLLNEAGDEWVGQTITELMFVPDQVLDGAYLLNLQVAPLVLDAAPSRPVLFSLQLK